MRRNIGFGMFKEERNNSSFFKILQTADLSSKSMRALPFNFMSELSSKDFSNKVMITTLWGRSWELQVSMNPIFYYMEKSGWNKFVNDNALGDDEFVTFTHRGNMCFNVSIYEHSGKERVMPRNPFGEIKKEQGKRSFKAAKIEEDETSEAMVGVEFKDRRYKKIKKVEKDVPEFTITIKKSYLKFLAIPIRFKRDNIPNGSKMFKIHDLCGNRSWDVCLKRETCPIFSCGWTKLAREYPLSLGDMCTLKLINPSEFVLFVSQKGTEEINVID